MYVPKWHNRKVASDYATGKIDLPKSHNEFIKNGWKDTTHQQAAKRLPNRHVYSKNGIMIIFEEAVENQPGFKGIEHYHILNPKSVNNFDKYLDRYGNPVPKNSKQSHILKKK